MSKFKFALGKECKDKITGFKGVITGRVQYLTGCNQYSLTPRESNDGKVPDSHWFDEARIEEVQSGNHIKKSEVSVKEDPGCDIAPPSKS